MREGIIIVDQSTPTKIHSATYKIENVVVNVKLFRDVDLGLVAESYKDVEFNLNRFPGVCVRLKKPKATILLFKNGKMVITGLKKSKYALSVVNKVISRLDAIGIKITEPPSLKVVNIVVALNVGHKINLDEASLFMEHTIYEPEVFPGLIFRIQEPKAVFLIFSSGKVVLTGLKTEEQIVPMISQLGKILKANGLLD